jgi:hypothetical protein
VLLGLILPKSSVLIAVVARLRNAQLPVDGLAAASFDIVGDLLPFVFTPGTEDDFSALVRKQLRVRLSDSR